MKQTITINWAWFGVYFLLALILSFNIYALSGKSESRSITVEGSATIDAQPDSYVFYPQYVSKETDPAVAKSALAAKAKEVVAKLKGLGLQDKNIKVSANQYEDSMRMMSPDITGQNSSLNLTITVQTLEVAQKVQDYLDSTDATGQLTPQPTFSEDKRKELTKLAEAKAVKDAQSKADTLAQNLGSKRGKVISVQNSDEGPIALSRQDSVSSTAIGSSFPVQPGTDEFSYRVVVKFALR